MKFVKKKILSVSKNKFLRSIAVVAGGTAGAQAVTMGFSPLVTRLYTPEAFGVLGVFLAIVSFLSPVSTLGYPVAIVLPEEKKDAQALLSLSVILPSVFSFILLMMMLANGEWFLALSGLESATWALYLIPLAVLFLAIHDAVSQTLIRQKKFNSIARVTLIHSFFLNTAKVCVGFFSATSNGLLGVASAGNAFNLFLCLKVLRRERKEWKKKVFLDIKRMRKVAVRYKDFPFYRAPEIAISSASQSLPIFMLSLLFGASSAGYYTLARSVMAVPSLVIGKSVGDVIYPKLSEAYQLGNPLFPIIFKTTAMMAFLGLLPFGFVFLFGPWFFSLVFGSDWLEAGEYARWIGVWMFFMFLNSPSVKTLPILSMQNIYLLYTIVTISLRALVIYLAYLFYNDVVAVLLFGVLGAVSNIALIIFIFRACKRHDINLQT